MDPLPDQEESVCPITSPLIEDRVGATGCRTER
jgi:hypothetical protein